MPLRSFYPETAPRQTGRLRVSGLHEIHFECSGKPGGKPVIVLHGGPGGGTSPTLRRFHDPDVYNIVAFDQRGCGLSAPSGELRENTTWDLVADIEALRKHLGLGVCQVFGGSWGSTLALAYAQTHPESVCELILRGIFLGRREDIHWFYQDGCSHMYPDAWSEFIEPIPPEERGDLVAAYYKRLAGDDDSERLKCARAWSQWEGKTISLLPNPARVANFGQETFAKIFARIECHYFVNRCFFAEDDHLLKNMHRIRHIPGAIVHGRYDVVTAPKGAWDLHRVWPEAALEFVADAGHTMTEPGITDALVRATDRFRNAAVA
jgi:proline iminopeptidase